MTARESPRRIGRTIALPPPAPGFAGPGHTAVEVLGPDALGESDPFVLLMDDRIDFAPGRRIGGAHPHAGLETVTLVLEGTLRDRDEGELVAGDALWMTAGRGIIHNEEVEATGASRVLQLWVGLPSAHRDAAPSFQLIAGASVPVHRAAGVVARLYSGATAGLRSPTTNRVPVTLVDVALEPGARFDPELPASYRGFVYVLSGALTAGPEGTPIAAGEIGWLGRADGSAPTTTLALVASAAGARAVIYAGEPHGERLVQRGPFVAGSLEEIARQHHAFRAGRFTRMSDLARSASSAGATVDRSALARR